MEKYQVYVIRQVLYNCFFCHITSLAGESLVPLALKKIFCDIRENWRSPFQRHESTFIHTDFLKPRFLQQETLSLKRFGLEGLLLFSALRPSTTRRMCTRHEKTRCSNVNMCHATLPHRQQVWTMELRPAANVGSMAAPRV